MRSVVFFFLTLGLLAAQYLTGSTILQTVLFSEPADSGESPNRGWEIDPDGSTTSSDETPDRGWAMDPDG